MKKFTIILVALISLNGAYAQWTKLQSPLQRGKVLRFVQFVDVNTGFVGGDSGLIEKTIDAGTTWNVLTSGTTNNLNSVYFTDISTGYAVGSSGTILKTIDGGATWTALRSGVTGTLNSVYFTDANTGYAVGGDSFCIIIKTIDGGITWNNILSFAVKGYLTSVHFVDKTGYAVGVGNQLGFGTQDGLFGMGLHTEDGGETWFELPYGPFSAPFFSVKSADINNWFYVGGQPDLERPSKYCEIVKYNLFGDIAIKISSSTACLKSIYFTDANTGYTVGDFGFILKTSNGGVDWTDQSSLGTYHLNSVYFTDAFTGYAVGIEVDSFQVHLNGVILKTTTGGESPLGLNTLPQTLNSFKIYPNPSSDIITVETSTSLRDLSILDMKGQELITRKITVPLTQINISTLPKGVYQVKIVGEKGMQVGRIIKQ